MDNACGGVAAARRPSISRQTDRCVVRCQSCHPLPTHHGCSWHGLLRQQSVRAVASRESRRQDVPQSRRRLCRSAAPAVCHNAQALAAVSPASKAALELWTSAQTGLHMPHMIAPSMLLTEFFQASRRLPAHSSSPVMQQTHAIHTVGCPDAVKGLPSTVNSFNSGRSAMPASSLALASWLWLMISRWRLPGSSSCCGGWRRKFSSARFVKGVRSARVLMAFEEALMMRRDGTAVSGCKHESAFACTSNTARFVSDSKSACKANC